MSGAFLRCRSRFLSALAHHRLNVYQHVTYSQHGHQSHENWNFLKPLCAVVTFAASTAAASRERCKCEEPTGNEESLVLSADCGGTNTRLMLYSVNPQEPILEQQLPPGRLLKEIKYPNLLFNGLDTIIKKFLEECKCGTDLGYPDVCVLAVAGVVANNSVRYTNLDWVVDGFELQQKLNIPRVEIINDFVAQGYGALTLRDDEVIKVNDVPPVAGAPACCIGAGTGLGQCFLACDSYGEYKCYPSEGGHVEFAPRGAGNEETQIDLLRHLKVKFSGWNRISVERVVSGKGICNVYEFLSYYHPKDVDNDVHVAFKQDPENAGVIAKNATPGSLCEKAMKIFASCYGSHVGAMALHYMPFKGIYVTGGVTQKCLGFLQNDRSFLEAYNDKGRVSPLLKRIPLYLVKIEDMGQRGAHYRAVQVLHQSMEGRSFRARRSADFSVEDLPAPRPGGDFDEAELAYLREKYRGSPGNVLRSELN